MIRTDLPDGADVIDLGAARASRAERRAKDGKGATYVKLAAGYIEVLPEIPVAAAFALENGEIRAGLSLMLVDRADVDALIDDGLTADDMETLSKHLTGRGTGE